MKKILILAFFFLLAGCSSQDLALEDLKEKYPQTFGNSIEALSKDQQEKIGLPDEVPFNVASVEASSDEDRVQVHYQSEGKKELKVRTIYDPGNILKESELQVNLNSGAVAGVQEHEDHVYVEWYNNKDDVVYQLEYYGADNEKRTQKAIEIANAI
ncbi:putative periplasmic lipoprotein [Halobacillus mangrovi]|uniref:DUF4367 domain-containing protein n=1 Tax=Halobacillus mangrovi TaxID=402384 RepID=A0A1W5ZYI0_9BACI|nr:hypothetical protein [Halobacillus mangrovi]ARI78329.1 hypothetical protein HM131_16455 [Halobacillus mangrovi]